MQFCTNSSRLPTINDYINLLNQEDLLRKKEEEAYFTFAFYNTQRSMHKTSAMKFSPPSIDFDYQLPNSKTKYPYPFPVNLGQKTHYEKVCTVVQHSDLQDEREPIYHAVEFEKSLYAEQIMSFLNPFLDSLVLERQQTNGKQTLFDHVINRFELYCKEHEEEKNHLKQLMGVERYYLKSFHSP